MMQDVLSAVRRTGRNHSLQLRLIVFVAALLMFIPVSGAMGTPVPLGAASPTAASHATTPALRAGPSVASGAYSPKSGADNWQEFQHDPWNSGVSGDTPVRPVVSWNASLPKFGDGPDSPFVGSPVVGQGNVYVPVGDVIKAFNATSGLPVWSRTLTTTATPAPTVDQTPLLWRGMLFVAEDLGAGFPTCAGADCSSLYVLNATNGTIMQDFPTGTIWAGTAAPGSPVPLVGPAFGGDTGILFVNHNGYTYTYSWNGTSLAAVGDDHVARQGGTRTTSTPSVVYVPGLGWGAFFLDGRGNQRVDAVQLSGAAALPFLTGYPVGDVLGGGVTVTWTSTNTGSISIANFTSAGGPYPVGFFGDDAGAGATSLLVALNLSTHTPLATAQLLTAGAATVDNGLYSAPAVVPINSTAVGLVITDLNGSVSRYNFTYNAVGGAAAPSWMNLSWSKQTGSSIEGSPAVAGSTVYVGNGAGGLWALNVDTGAIQWNTTLSSAIRSNFALGYSRLYVVSDPVGGGTTANLTAFGPPGRNRLEISPMASPAQVASGGTSMIVVNASWIYPHGGYGGPASTAVVNFSAALGTFQTSSVPINANGHAYDNWTAPGTSPVWYNVSVSVDAWAPFNVSAASSVKVTVMPGSSVVITPLNIVISPSSSSLALGSNETLTITATTTGGAAVAGATVLLTTYGPGSLNTTSPPVTDSSGQTTVTFTAPASLPYPQVTLINATATETGYANASASAVVLMSMASMSASISPSNSKLSVGGSETLTITVVTSTGSPLANATVTLTQNGAGSLSTSTPPATNAAGQTAVTFTAPSSQASPQVTIINASVSAAGYANTGASAVIQTSPSSALMSASISPSNSRLSAGGSEALTITVVTAAGSPLANAAVTLVQNGLGSLSTTTPPLTNAEGLTTVMFKAPSTLTTANSTLMVATVTLAGYTSTSASATVSLLPATTVTYAISVVAVPAETTVQTGSSTQVTITVTNVSSATSTPAADAFVVVFSSPSGPGVFSSFSMVTDSRGVANFTFVASKNDTGAVLATFTVSGSHYATTSTVVSISVIAPASATNSNGMRSLDYALIALVVLLAVILLLVLILGRRRRHPPTTSTATKETEVDAAGATALAAESAADETPKPEPSPPAPPTKEPVEEPSASAPSEVKTEPPSAGEVPPPPPEAEAAVAGTTAVAAEPSAGETPKAEPEHTASPENEPAEQEDDSEPSDEEPETPPAEEGSSTSEPAPSPPTRRLSHREERARRRAERAQKSDEGSSGDVAKEGS